MNKLFSFYNNLILSKYRKDLRRIKKIYSEFKGLSIDELKSTFLVKAKNVQENRMFLIAIIKEVIKRALKIELYDEQIIGAMLMYDGYIVEMKTGEGKTYSILVTTILKSLENVTYVVTVNNYLAKRDIEKLKEVYECLGIKVAYNEEFSECSNQVEDKKKIHTSNIIYTSTTELIFDYLRMRNGKIKDGYEIKLENVIVDEIDFVLIDNATSSCSVSTGTNYKLPNALLDKYRLAKKIYEVFEGIEIKKSFKDIMIYEYYDSDYVYSKYNKTFTFTKKGLDKICKMYSLKSVEEDLELYGALLYTFEVNLFFEKDVDYMVVDNEISIINKENGRCMRGSKWQTGINLAIEVKENLNVTGGNLYENSIAYQVFFNKFKYLSGMSGTVYEAKDEFFEVFDTPICIVPETNKSIRKDYDDILFKTNKEKHEYLIKLVKKNIKNKRPILIVTSSEKETSLVSEVLKSNIENVKFNILNNLTVKEEEDIIKNAGNKGCITISTNMAGRGTDIILDKDSKENEGLLVISLIKYKNKRIDRQVKGRAGRQGEEGGSICLISLEDEIFDHLDIKDLDDYLELEEELFYSKKFQFVFSKKIKKLQDEISRKEYNYRKYDFKFGTIIEDIREYVNSDSCSYIDDIIKKEDIKEKIKEVGEIESKEILKKLYNINMKKRWNELNARLRYLKNEIFLYGLAEDQIIVRFIEYSNKYLKEVEKLSLEETIENFMTIEKVK